MAENQAVLDIRNDLIRTMNESREVTEEYMDRSKRVKRLGQLIMRLFAGLL